MFGFQKLDVYRCAVTFLGVASRLAERVPRGHSALSDQLRRAALSVPLNIAEGNGKFASKDRCRYFDIAHSSALECAAALARQADTRLTRSLLEPSSSPTGKRSPSICRITPGSAISAASHQR